MQFCNRVDIQLELQHHDGEEVWLGSSGVGLGWNFLLLQFSKGSGTVVCFISDQFCISLVLILRNLLRSGTKGKVAAPLYICLYMYIYIYIYVYVYVYVYVYIIHIRIRIRIHIHAYTYRYISALTC